MPDIRLAAPPSILPAPTQAPQVRTSQRRWSRFTLGWGRSHLEVDGLSLFLRLGRVEVYARRRASYDPRWRVVREPGSVEGYGLGMGLTASRRPS